MTPTEAKDQVAQDNGYKDWEHVLRCCFDDDILTLWPDVTKLYASEKVKEALQLAGERAEVKKVIAYSKISKIDKQEKRCFVESCPGIVETISVSEDSILSLLPELIEKLNKEI